MLSENIGFDYDEEDFVNFSAENTLMHLVIGNAEQGSDVGFSINSMDETARVFLTAKQACDYLNLNNNKRVVCITSLPETNPQIKELLATNVVCNVTFVENKKSHDSPALVRSVDNFKFKNSTALFGFYELINIVASQTPKSEFQEKITEAFRSYLTNAPIENLSSPVSTIVMTLKSIFEKECAFEASPGLIMMIKEFVRKIRKLKRKALIVVDVQNDFCEGGSLQVPNSNMIFEPINELKKKIPFLKIILTKDMHPQNHISFGSTHNMNPFVTIYDEQGVGQELWPDHCVVGTTGCELSELLQVTGKEEIVDKGTKVEEDSYSGFGKHENPTRLLSILNQNRIEVVIVVGLALDFCVGSTAIDSVDSGFETYIMEEGTKAAMSSEKEKMLTRLEAKEVKLVSFDNILRVFA